MGEKGGKTSLAAGGAGRMRDRAGGTAPGETEAGATEAGETGGSRDRALLHSKLLSFSCASWKRVRIFGKESPGFSKMRTSRKREPLRNHLRTFGRASALHPVTLTRKVAQARASASAGSPHGWR